MKEYLPSGAVKSVRHEDYKGWCLIPACADADDWRDNCAALAEITATTDIGNWAVKKQVPPGVVKAVRHEEKKERKEEKKHICL